MGRFGLPVFLFGFITLALVAFDSPAQEGVAGRAELERKAEAQILPPFRAAASKCGYTFDVDFDWASFTDEDLQSYEPGPYCEATAAALGKLCGSSLTPYGAEAVREQIDGVLCAHGEARHVSIEDRILVFTIDPEASNSMDFIYEFLERNL